MRQLIQRHGDKKQMMMLFARNAHLHGMFVNCQWSDNGNSTVDRQGIEKTLFARGPRESDGVLIGGRV